MFFNPPWSEDWNQRKTKHRTFQFKTQRKENMTEDANIKGKLQPDWKGQ